MLRVLLFWVACMGVLVIAGVLVPAGGGALALLCTGVIAMAATLLLTAAFLRWDRRPAEAIGIVPDRGTPRRFALGLLAGLTLVAVHTACLSMHGGVRWVAVSSPPPVMATMATVLGYLLLAWREELAFRAYPLRTLDRAAGPAIAQIVVILLFVVEHRLGGNTWSNALLGAGAGALVFGAAALATRGLALALGLHAGWNLADWARGGKGADGFWVAEVVPGHARDVARFGLAIYLALMGMTWLLLEWWRRRTEPAATG
jgi:membrane protease YdiL (CAAX protease family)